MLKSCFECEADVILTDVIHKEIGSGCVLFGTGALIKFTEIERVVEYTCRSCGAKWYVTVGQHIEQEEIVDFIIK